ncbi:MAG: hypothetical protein EBX99_08305 [Acidimicrobiia bacterium]|nr:hypothetical protein [Acidimicrobiia bacterium]
MIASGDIDPSTAFLLGLGPSPVFPKRGDRGVAVTALQNALVATGISVRGGVDGVFGSGTAAAISAFHAPSRCRPRGNSTTPPHNFSVWSPRRRSPSSVIEVPGSPKFRTNCSRTASR